MRTGKISELFVFQDFKQINVDEVQAGRIINMLKFDQMLILINQLGDICAVSGISDIKIGETLTDPMDPRPLPLIKVEEPTVTMTFLVNTSPFSGKEGKLVTTRNIKERLERELERNLALRVTKGTSSFIHN